MAAVMRASRNRCPPAGSDSLDLTQRAPGLALELVLWEKVSLVLVRPGRLAGDSGSSARLLFTPTRPGLVFTPDKTPTGPEQAKRFLETARKDLQDPQRIWRGVTLLQGTVARWGKTAPGLEARALLKEIVTNEKLLQLIGD